MDRLVFVVLGDMLSRRVGLIAVSCMGETIIVYFPIFMIKYIHEQ